jgi:hypothetical protein
MPRANVGLCLFSNFFFFLFSFSFLFRLSRFSRFPDPPPTFGHAATDIPTTLGMPLARLRRCRTLSFRTPQLRGSSPRGRSTSVPCLTAHHRECAAGAAMARAGWDSPTFRQAAGTRVTPRARSSRCRTCLSAVVRTTATRSSMSRPAIVIRACCVPVEVSTVLGKRLLDHLVPTLPQTLAITMARDHTGSNLRPRLRCSQPVAAGNSRRTHGP